MGVFCARFRSNPVEVRVFGGGIRVCFGSSKVVFQTALEWKNGSTMMLMMLAC